MSYVYITNMVDIPVRSEKSFGDNIVRSLSSGSKLSVLQVTEDGWTKIRYKDATGWIISRYLKHVEQGTYITDEVDIPIRSEKSFGDNIVRSLSSGSKLSVLQVTEDGWTKIRYKDATGWIISRYLTSKKPVSVIPNNSISSELSDTWVSNDNRTYNISDCIDENAQSSNSLYDYYCEDESEYYSGLGEIKGNIFYPDALINSLADASITNPDELYSKGVEYFEKWKTKGKGLKLIQKLANFGYSKAQHLLGDMHSMNGPYGGLSIDYGEENAFKWYKKSANQGYAESQYEVGAMYHYGEGISKKYSEAIRWYTKAALQNQVDAQYELGQMYTNGQGVPVNYKKAIRWYSLAAEQNDTRASNKVKELLLVKLALNSGFTQQEISESEGVQNKKTALNFGFTQQEISKGEGIQNFNRARKVANIDTSPPEIRTYNSDSFTTTEKYITLSGDIKDDSKIAKVTINGKEVAIKNDGFNQFVVPEYIQLGRNEFNIVSIDVFGNKSSKKIVFNREKAVSKNKDKRLAPPTTVRRSSPNAVALIIGVDKYESIASAPWAESDASVFYDYVQNTLGISEDRIKLLTGSESSEAGIWKSIERWLPTEVDKNKSDVYVYFAGHGLASTDGNNAYLIPWDGDTDLLERTAILRSELIDGLKDLDAKSVTLFMDTCYSGKARGGKGTLVANSRGLRIVKKDKLNNLPSNFTLFSAAGNDETASSHPSLKHGLFSYWMMRGLGGDADSNNDRKITNGELHVFIDKNVQKNAVSMGRKQHPQLVGDKDKVIASW